MYICPVLRLSTPPWVGSPGSTPRFPSICKLLAAFLRSSLVFARSLQHFWLPASHLLGTCYLLGDLRSTHTPSKYLRATYSHIYMWHVSTSYLLPVFSHNSTCVEHMPYLPYIPMMPCVPYLWYLSYIPHIPYIWNIITTPTIHTIPNIHAIHTIHTLHRKHSIPIIVTIHTIPIIPIIQTTHTIHMKHNYHTYHAYNTKHTCHTYHTYLT